MDSVTDSLSTDMGNSGSVSPERTWYSVGKKVRFIHRNKLVTGRIVSHGKEDPQHLMLHIQWHDVIVFRQLTSVLRPK
jgi:hypothetical protein